MFNRKTRANNNIIGIPNLKSNVDMFNRNSIVRENKNTNINVPSNRMKIVTSIKNEN